MKNLKEDFRDWASLWILRFRINLQSFRWFSFFVKPNPWFVRNSKICIHVDFTRNWSFLEFEFEFEIISFPVRLLLAFWGLDSIFPWMGPIDCEETPHKCDLELRWFEANTFEESRWVWWSLEMLQRLQRGIVFVNRFERDLKHRKQNQNHKPWEEAIQRIEEERNSQVEFRSP